VTTTVRRKDGTSGFVVTPRDLLTQKCLGQRIHRDDAITGVLIGRFSTITPSAAHGCVVTVSCRDETGAEIHAATQLVQNPAGKEPAWEGTASPPRVAAATGSAATAGKHDVKVESTISSPPHDNSGRERPRWSNPFKDSEPALALQPIPDGEVRITEKPSIYKMAYGRLDWNSIGTIK
jgi:hypothetical protein